MTYKSSSSTPTTKDHRTPKFEDELEQANDKRHSGGRSFSFKWIGLGVLVLVLLVCIIAIPVTLVKNNDDDDDDDKNKSNVPMNDSDLPGEPVSFDVISFAASSTSSSPSFVLKISSEEGRVVTKTVTDDATGEPVEVTFYQGPLEIPMLTETFGQPFTLYGAEIALDISAGTTSSGTTAAQASSPHVDFTLMPVPFFAPGYINVPQLEESQRRRMTNLRGNIMSQQQQQQQQQQQDDTTTLAIPSKSRSLNNELPPWLSNILDLIVESVAAVFGADFVPLSELQQDAVFSRYLQSVSVPDDTMFLIVSINDDDDNNNDEEPDIFDAIRETAQAIANQAVQFLFGDQPVQGRVAVSVNDDHPTVLVAAKDVFFGDGESPDFLRNITKYVTIDVEEIVVGFFFEDNVQFPRAFEFGNEFGIIEDPLQGNVFFAGDLELGISIPQIEELDMTVFYDGRLIAQADPDVVNNIENFTFSDTEAFTYLAAEAENITIAGGIPFFATTTCGLENVFFQYKFLNETFGHSMALAGKHISLSACQIVLLDVLLDLETSEPQFDIYFHILESSPRLGGKPELYLYVDGNATVKDSPIGIQNLDVESFISDVDEQITYTISGEFLLGAFSFTMNQAQIMAGDASFSYDSDYYHEFGTLATLEGKTHFSIDASSWEVALDTNVCFPWLDTNPNDEIPACLALANNTQVTYNQEEEEFVLCFANPLGPTLRAFVPNITELVMWREDRVCLGE